MPPFADNRHIKQGSIDQSAGGTTVLVADAAVPADMVAYIVFIAFGMAAAGTIQFQDTAGTALSGQMPFSANGGQVAAGDGYNPILEGPRDLGIQIVTTQAVDGWFRYFIGERQA